MINVSKNIRALMLAVCALLALLSGGRAYALDPGAVMKLCLGENDVKIEVINQLADSGDPAVLPLLQALTDGTLSVTADGKQALIISDAGVRDAVTLKPASTAAADAEKVVINNQIRSALDSAIAALKLSSPGKDDRLAATEELQRQANEDLLPLIDRAMAKERDPDVLSALRMAQACTHLKSRDPALRMAAVKMLAQSSRGNVKELLSALLAKGDDGQYAEPDGAIRAEIGKVIKGIDGSAGASDLLGMVFTGLSLGSILLLVALGLAITFGLMGIINMAHGELLMAGAYTTYLIHALFQRYLPDHFAWYLLAAVPASFLVAALVGMAMERCVIRFLYGRPLETLLATWGISLLLIQTVRMIFGAQNVEVMNPKWMSGGWKAAGGLVLPYNRIFIILFALIVVLLVWLVLNKTRLGLFVRAVTQNRSMADCVGVPTQRVDLMAFGLGSGIAGLGGCALSQIGNVGPELGQNYIVDSFMVVVLGGVGQLAGTVLAALGLGGVSKLLEPHAGAVLAKILLLVFIIVFIQKRPQGMFAPKGRSVEN
ncbi:MAG TPA: urea ABC transporter permease subunit UrtB [Geobacter sp.]|nr:urea ABC transporter permease subunit UrtB [Geobacter sp.]